MGPDGEPWPGLDVHAPGGPAGAPVPTRARGPGGGETADCGTGVTVAVCLDGYHDRAGGGEPGARGGDRRSARGGRERVLERSGSLPGAAAREGADERAARLRRGGMPVTRPRDEEGIVLLLVLVLVVVAISTAYAMSKTSLIEAMSTRQYGQYARATLLARSGIDARRARAPGRPDRGRRHHPAGGVGARRLGAALEAGDPLAG